MTRKKRYRSKNKSKQNKQTARESIDELMYLLNEYVPIQPDSRIKLESKPKGVTSRAIDLITPMGHGQRVLITSPPKAGKTTILKEISQSISVNHPDVYQVALLVDERPEEATDFSRSLSIDVEASTTDKRPVEHIKCAENVFSNCLRRVLMGEHVVILLDSITRLARAYNTVHGDNSRTMSGGISAGALDRPRQLFGAARNLENGGALTIIATALIDTGSKMDDVIFQEFKGTGNCELVLSRKLAEKRLFPAINISESGTRREDCLLTEIESRQYTALRRKLADLAEIESLEFLLNRIQHAPTNAQLLAMF